MPEDMTEALLLLLNMHSAPSISGPKRRSAQRSAPPPPQAPNDSSGASIQGACLCDVRTCAGANARLRIVCVSIDFLNQARHAAGDANGKAMGSDAFSQVSPAPLFKYDSSNAPAYSPLRGDASYRHPDYACVCLRVCWGVEV